MRLLPAISNACSLGASALALSMARRSGARVVIAEDSFAVIRHAGLAEDWRNRVHEERICLPIHAPLGRRCSLESRQRGVIGLFQMIWTVAFVR